MKILRTVVKKNKGLFSLWLLLSFITAATARNIAPVFQELSATEKAQNLHPSKYSVTAAADESAFNNLSPKDSDADDIEFICFDDYTNKKSIAFPVNQHDFIEIADFYSGYSIPLYDLYCNWKFHLC